MQKIQPIIQSLSVWIINIILYYSLLSCSIGATTTANPTITATLQNCPGGTIGTTNGCTILLTYTTGGNSNAYITGALTGQTPLNVPPPTSCLMPVSGSTISQTCQLSITYVDPSGLYVGQTETFTYSITVTGGAAATANPISLTTVN